MTGAKLHRTQSVLETINLDNGRRLIKKTATPTGELDLLNQLEFYQSVPEKIARHYPRIIDSNTRVKPYSFTMPYYSYPTLTKLVLYSKMTQEELSDRLMEVLSFLFGVQHNYRTDVPSSSYINDIYFSRVRNRLMYIANIDTLFNNIVPLKFIEINGYKISSPLLLLEKIANALSFLDKIRPKTVHFTHGQLRFDHILINLEELAVERFILLEPRGLSELRDVGYELGKIWQCLRSRILWIEQKEYSEYTFSISRDTLVIENFALRLNNRQDIADKMLSAIRKNLEEKYISIANWQVETLTALAEATHSCAAIPFFYERDNPSFGIAYYISGALALQNFFDAYLR